jgi:hypothetical protein
VGGADAILNVAQFGVAGLMGAMWLWERRYSRQREDELTEAHREILAQREHLSAVLDSLQGNTKVIAEFTDVQREVLGTLKGGMAGLASTGRRD